MASEAYHNPESPLPESAMKHDLFRVRAVTSGVTARAAVTTTAPVLQSARPRMANAFQTLKSIVILSLELTSLATDQGWFATVAGLYLSPVGRGHEQSAPSPALARLGEGRLMFARSRSRGMLTNRAQSRTDRELHRKAPCSGRGPPLKRESRPYGWAVT